MNWENTKPASEESKIGFSHLNSNSQMEEEQNVQEIMQLKKFKDPAQNIERQAIISLLTQFGDLSRTNNTNDMVKNVFTDECEFYLFNSTGRTPVQHCLQPKDLPNLYKGMQIQERIVRETHIDLEKGTACQMCDFWILYEGEDVAVEEIVAEIFTIKDHKISKYKAFAGKMTPAHGDSDPFEISEKDKALAVLKQLNYALADQPDFEKVADFLHENVIYKIWSWDSKKYYELGKDNFVQAFKDMQENFEIKSIIPYNAYTRQAAVCTYVYHLEGKTGNYANKKYVWPSTCFYQFDKDYKIIKASHQGEMRLEGDIEIQFTLHPIEKLLYKVQRIMATDGLSMDLFYQDVLALNVMSYSFEPDGGPNIGFSKGTDIINKVAEWNKRNNIQNNAFKHQLLEMLFDCCDSGYDIIILIYKLGAELYPFPGQENCDPEADTILVSRFKLEHGKIINNCGFIFHVPGHFRSRFKDFS